ncbi:MAG TPA: MBL fold metallo-hydrolase [Gemmatimonadaceae bacterium]|nr:MBL fold metallo-hydrolase [Gemmatimonadaceae bacterium]
MRTWLLGSGSRGNATVIESGDTRVLIDAGFPRRDLAKRLIAADIAPESISALVLTHEHVDHARGAASSVRRWKWPVYSTSGTFAQCADFAERREIAATETISIGALDLKAFPVPHDATSPIAVVATERTTGARIGLAYDFGHVTDSVRAALERVDVLIVESNHDEMMLRACPYPPSVRWRIAGPRGHLSNRAAAELVRSIAWRGLRQVVLAHLSETANEPEFAVAAMRKAWRGPLETAPQDALCVTGESEQLSLF